jgi:hypothetical protein
MAFGAALASAGTVSYTCDTTINATPAGTCAYLNSTTAGLYSSTFSNANASIYIKMGITGLGSSTVGSYNDLSYSTYLSDLTATASADTVDVHALTALNSKDTAVYGTGIVVITSALGEALGVPNSSLAGTTASGVSCTIGTGGCYNGIITITTPANLFTDTGQFLYWDQTGGIIGANAYDFYSIVEHETDEILGTSSCISTQGLSLTNPCNFLGVGTPSAVDLFRYSATTGTLLPDSSLSTTSGAYFSYNGGLTNGVPDGAVYNTLANGNDYADFAAYCQNVQDATGCLGSIQNISGGEINILDAVGYNLNSGPETPEPGTMALFGAGFAALAVYRRRRRA